MIEISVELPTKLLITFRLLGFGIIIKQGKGEVASPAPDELRFGYCCSSGSAVSGIASLVTADNVKEIQHIPSFIKFLNGENSTDGILFILKRIDENLIGFFLRFIVNGKAVPFLKIRFQVLCQLFGTDVSLIKEAKCALNYLNL